MLIKIVPFFAIALGFGFLMSIHIFDTEIDEKTYIPKGVNGEK